MPPGTYKLTTTLQGFSTGMAENVAVAIGKTTTIDFALNVGGVAEQVTVEADSQRVDVAQTTIQTNVTAAAIENLPKGTNMTSLLKLAPAARQEALSGGFQIDGASGSENSFMIDGLETGNFRTGVLNVNNNLPFEFIQEMSIKTSGFNAEFGGATGGVVSVVTKSGTNSFRGMGGIEFEGSAMNGNPRPTLNSFRSGTGANFVQVNEYLDAQGRRLHERVPGVRPRRPDPARQGVVLRQLLAAALQRRAHDRVLHDRPAHPHQDG